MDHNTLKRWLADYGRAWEHRDPEAAAALSTPDSLYYWTPFQQPKAGRHEHAEAWRQATTGQRDIHFRSEILAIVGNRGLARWWCSLVPLSTGKRVRVEGIFQMDFGEGGLCKEFREWWHSDEGPPE